MKRGLGFAACLVVAAVCCATSAFGLSYNIIDLDAFAKGLYQAHGINDSGQIVGGFAGSPCLLQNEELTVLDGSGWASGINNNGDIISLHASIWRNGIKQDLGALPEWDYSYATAINNAGQVVGYCQSNPQSLHEPGFIWQDDEMTNLGSLYDCYTIPLGINDVGQVVGYSGGHAFLWQNGEMQDIDTVPGENGGGGCDINNHGDIAGYVNLISGEQHPCLWIDNIGQDLGVLQGFVGGKANAINDDGLVAGTLWDANGLTRGFVWKDGVMQDLGTLGGDSSGVYGMNERGQIIGYARTASKSQHAVLWQPAVPEPSSILVLITGAGSLMLFTRRAKR